MTNGNVLQIFLFDEEAMIPPESDKVVDGNGNKFGNQIFSRRNKNYNSCRFLVDK